MMDDRRRKTEMKMKTKMVDGKWKMKDGRRDENKQKPEVS